MDAVEILMMEHSGIRLISSNNLLNTDMARLLNFYKFLDGNHVAVEEHIVFPEIRLYSPESAKLLDRLIADHKLIEKLFTNLIKWNENEDPLFKIRLPLFYKILTEHNALEEAEIFKSWVKVDQESRIKSLKEINDLIVSNNIDNYMHETGVSREQMRYIFG
ncbi:MAG: hemerythrin domain-containing protein [Ferroplasma sp.]